MSESNASYAARCVAHVGYYTSLIYLYGAAASFYAPDIIEAQSGYAFFQPATVAVVMVVAVGIGYKAAKDVPTRSHE